MGKFTSFVSNLTRKAEKVGPQKASLRVDPIEKKIEIKKESKGKKKK